MNREEMGLEEYLSTVVGARVSSSKSESVADCIWCGKPKHLYILMFIDFDINMRRILYVHGCF